jgi:hypothetical protein
MCDLAVWGAKPCPAYVLDGSMGFPSNREGFLTLRPERTRHRPTPKTSTYRLSRRPTAGSAQPGRIGAPQDRADGAPRHRRSSCASPCRAVHLAGQGPSSATRRRSGPARCPLGSTGATLCGRRRPRSSPRARVYPGVRVGGVLTPDLGDHADRPLTQLGRIVVHRTRR